MKTNISSIDFTHKMMKYTFYISCVFSGNIFGIHAAFPEFIHIQKSIICSTQANVFSIGSSILYG